MDPYEPVLTETVKPKQVRKIIYLINPISGTRNKNSLAAIISNRTKERGIPFEIVPTTANGDYSSLKQKISKEKITDVVICGGDGSINQVVHQLADLNTRFGVIPLGSGNGLALTAKISKDPNKALDIIFEGHAKKIDGFLVNEQFACMLCGLGFDAVVAHAFAKAGKRGLATYAKLSAMNFFKASTYQFEVEANGFSFPCDAYFISIANSNQFGNNFTIAPEAKLADGLLDVVIVKKAMKPMLVWNVARQVLRGKITSIENSAKSPVIYFQTTELKIINRENAMMHIDGEPKDAPEILNIRILPKYFKLIQPA